MHLPLVLRRATATTDRALLSVSFWGTFPAVLFAGWLVLTAALPRWGLFHPLPVAIAAAAASLLLIPALRATWAPGEPRWFLPAIAALPGLSGLAGWVMHGEYLIAYRDHALYALNGSWLAEHGTFRLSDPLAFLGGMDGVHAGSAGFYDNGDHVQFQAPLPLPWVVVGA